MLHYYERGVPLVPVDANVPHVLHEVLPLQKRVVAFRQLLLVLLAFCCCCLLGSKYFVIVFK